jgi:hypothetical protein
MKDSIAAPNALKKNRYGVEWAGLKMGGSFQKTKKNIF